MANVTPALAGGTGFAPKGSFWSELDSAGGMASTEVVLTVGQLDSLNGCTLQSFYFSSVGDTDTWDSSSTSPPPRGLRGIWCKGDDVDDDLVNAYITDPGGPHSDSAVEFQTNGAGKSVHVLVAYRG